MRFLLSLIFATVILGEVASRAEGVSPRRVVAFGDSTTAPRGGLVVYATLLEKAISSPGILPCTFINAGVGGNTTTVARWRFAADVLAVKPDLVIIQFGINDSMVDVWKNPPATVSRVPIETYRENLRYFIEAVHAANAKAILMTPNPLRWTPALQKKYGRSPYDPDRVDGFNVVLANYAEAARNLAKELKVPLIDVTRAYEKFAEHSTESLLLDGMHPNQRGHELVAQLLAELIYSQSLLGAAHAAPAQP